MDISKKLKKFLAKNKSGVDLEKHGNELAKTLKNLCEQLIQEATEKPIYKKVKNDKEESDMLNFINNFVDQYIENAPQLQDNREELIKLLKKSFKNKKLDLDDPKIVKLLKKEFTTKLEQSA